MASFQKWLRPLWRDPTESPFLFVSQFFCLWHGALGCRHGLLNKRVDGRESRETSRFSE